MKDILLLKQCESCGGNLTLMESIRTDNGKLMLVERCLKCGCHPVTEVAELKHDDPQTQADLELAAAVKLAFKKQSTLEIPCGDGNIDIIYQKFELLDWYREQKRGETNG